MALKAKVRGKETNFIFQNSSIFLTDLKLNKNTEARNEIQIRHILKVCPLRRRYSSDQHVTSFKIFFSKQKTNKKLKVADLVVQGTASACEEFRATIVQRIEELKRPKRLLVIINPKSGRKNAEDIYNSYAKPVFDICGIQVDVKVTTRSKETLGILETYPISDVDGIVVVGGDGSYCECINGLLTRTQRDAGVDHNNSEVQLLRPNIPLGIIPAGSGDYGVQYVHETRDAGTAAIKIALGNTIRVNTVGIYEEKRLLSYSGLLVGFGLSGDMMHDCEKFRCIGPLRFQVIPVATFLKRRTFDLSIDYLPVDQDGKVIRRQNSNNGWEKTNGMAHAVDTFIMSKKQTQGLTSTFADSTMNAFVTEKCKLMDHLSQLTKLKEQHPSAFDFDFIKQLRTIAYRVRIVGSPITRTEDGKEHLKEKCYINCDGEVLQLSRPEFEVRFHHQSISLFGEP